MSQALYITVIIHKNFLQQVFLKRIMMSHWAISLKKISTRVKSYFYLFN